MKKFTVHTHETAPKAAKKWLDEGFNPNLYGIMAEEPPLLETYKISGELLGQTCLTPLEQQVVMMVVNYQNNCTYCVPWHTYSMLADGIEENLIEALRNGTPLPDAKLEALRMFTREMIEHHGHVGTERLQTLLDADYTHQHVLGIILAVSHKLISNYTNAVAQTELDALPRPYRWTKPE